MNMLVEENAQTIKSFTPGRGLSERAASGMTLPTITDEPHRVLERDGFQLSMGAIPEREDERPPSEIVRGRCPECGEVIVANMYWHADRGYLLRYECWEGLLPKGRCRFYAVP